MELSEKEKKILERIPSEGISERDLIDSVDMGFIDVLDIVSKLRERERITRYKKGGLKYIRPKIKESDKKKEKEEKEVVTTKQQPAKPNEMVEILQNREIEVDFNQTNPGKLYAFFLPLHLLAQYPEGVKVSSIASSIKNSTKSYTLKQLEKVGILKREGKYAKKYHITPQFVQWIVNNIDLDKVISFLRSIEENITGDSNEV